MWLHEGLPRAHGSEKKFLNTMRSAFAILKLTRSASEVGFALVNFKNRAGTGGQTQGREERACSSKSMVLPSTLSKPKAGPMSVPSKFGAGAVCSWPMAL